MKKRGLSNVIFVVLIILIAILLMVLVWNLLLPIFLETGEITEVKTRLLTQSVGINHVEMSNGIVTIVIGRGPTRINIESLEEIEILPMIDLFSVTDLSGSMDDNCPGGSADPGETPCKINDAKDANNFLIGELLSVEENRVGLVGYSSNANNDFHVLSIDQASLELEVSGWAAGGGTCICCGINKAAENFDDLDKNKVMVVMSDGAATVECPVVTGDLDNDGDSDDASDDAIQAAIDAAAQDIAVYTVGFGSGIDPTTMIAIATAGGGTYFFSDVEDLAEIYTDVISEINAEYSYGNADQFLLVVFYNEDESEGIRIDNPPIQPFEAIAYDLNPEIENIIRIEIYLGIIAPSGAEIIMDTPIDVWEA